MSERWDDESVLRDWLSVLGRQKWIVLLAVVTVPLIAFAASSSQQRLYQSSADVLVNEQNPTAAALNLTTSVGSPPDRYAATQARLARVGTVAQMAVKAADLPDRTAAGLLANSSVSVNPNVDLLTFSVTGPHPECCREAGRRLRAAVHVVPEEARHRRAISGDFRRAPKVGVSRRFR